MSSGWIQGVDNELVRAPRRVGADWLKPAVLEYIIIAYNAVRCYWPRGLMAKAPDFGSGDCAFESHRGRDVSEFCIHVFVSSGLA